MDKTPKRKAIQWVYKGIGCFFTVLTAALVILISLSYWLMGDWLGWIKIYRTFYIVETHYADTIDKKTLLDGAVKGIVSTLGDKHSLYMAGDEFKEFKDQMSSSYAGIGVYIGNTDAGIMIAGIIDDSPASEAALKRGDLIIAIDGTPTEGMKLEDVSKKIRGPVQTDVTLTIREDGVDKEVTLTRRQIHMKTVMGQMVEGTNIGYIRIGVFGEDTGTEFTKEYQSLREQGMEKMILDLRNNPGGLVDQAVDVAGNFMLQGSTVVSFTSSDGNTQTFEANGTGDTIPMVVLINENSASASEIVSGSIQDLGLGKIIGVRSYGKGTVQGVYGVSQDDAIKLTVAKYHTASGREIDGTGIEPDIIVQLQPNDTVDYQLQKALDVVKEE